MRIFWKIFRAIASVLLLLAVVLPAAIYVILSLEPIQTTVRTTASEQLSDLLGADVRVRYVRIHPFNRVTVGGISLALGSDTVAQVETVSAGFDLWPLISKGDIIFDYALLDGVTAHINRATPESGLNIQPIIDPFAAGELEEKLSSALSKMEGAGEVTVVLTLDATAGQVLAREESETEGGGRSESRSEVVLASKGSGTQEPVPLRLEGPSYRGALVISPGGGDPAVRLALTEAVSALTGLGADKISICIGK